MEFFSQTLILFIFLTCFTIPKLGDLLPFYCILFFNYLRYVLKKITYSLSLCFGQIPVSQNECFAAILWHPKAIINLCGICQLHFPYSWRGSGEHRCGLSRLLFQLQQFLETKHLFFFFSSLVHLFPVCSLRH